MENKLVSWVYHTEIVNIFSVPFVPDCDDVLSAAGERTLFSGTRIILCLQCILL